ncbi:thioredoxin-like protein [Kockovaella imperatae]|uniref:Thioredoxin-like protein n=1 Tax=Kockovaella imperatae TaxID=4999 RepID=A0A1Y1URT3_9TREE|nr:thioredoxin-like protein [Kockovaella imperatae]ORX40758.1 thioredoxin-like protein [Kockovaella imperatae]
MSGPPSPTLSDSALLDSLDDDPRFDIAADRDRRMEKLKEEVEKVKQLQESDYRKVVTFTDERKLIERMSKDKYCILHFFHPDFQRCQIMDRRLEELAPKHPYTLFIRASVADIPFLVTKFNIKVLPCVLVFADSRCVDQLVGFEEFGNSDHFSAKALEFRLKESGALPEGKPTLVNTLSSSLLDPHSRIKDDSDDESDGDETAARRSRGTGPRRGKTGIRNGLLTGMDEDE